MSRSGDLWAITSYFNPIGYKTRLKNYRTFRDNLKAPLVTVELGYGDRFDLTSEDAECLIQLRTDQVMWQKERLLNIALGALPDDCRFVAWLDCDIVFQREDWLAAAVAALEQHVLIQPYSIVHDLERGADVTDVGRDGVLFERTSMILLYLAQFTDFGAASPNNIGQESPGLAWAMRRDAIDAAGLYDAMILGSGDFVMAMATIGRSEDVVKTYPMNQFQAEHYRRWSTKWNGTVNGHVGVVEGTLYHLWHGHWEDRGFGRRYAAFERFEFDPDTDIEIDGNGVWRWSSNKPELHQYVAQYFRSRREDGS